MKKESYILKRLGIHKMPGFPRGMKALDDLAENINIITGPNASGKSSTARMIRKTIWHKNTHGLAADASVMIDTNNWEIKIDSDHIIVQRDGQGDRISGIPAIEAQHRYVLSLHSLITAKEKDLAAEIVRESIGGYDLDAAKRDLGYLANIKNRGVSEYRIFDEADKNYIRIRNEQRGLESEQNKLTLLYEDKTNAENAHKLNQLYEQYASYFDAKLKYDLLNDQLQEYSESINKITGGEISSINELEVEIKRAADSIEEAGRNIESGEEVLQKLRISEDGVERSILVELDTRLQELTNLERKLQDIKLEIESSKSKEQEALKSFDEPIDTADWKALKIGDISGLDKMLQDALQVIGEKEFLLAEIRVLEKQVSSYQKPVGNTENILQGIRTLGNWLKEQNSSSGLPVWAIVVLSFLGILTAVLTYFIGWLGLLGIVLILIFSVFVYLKFNAEHKNTRVHVREQDFIKSGLTPPTSWSVEKIATRIDELIDSLKKIKEYEAIEEQFKVYKEELGKLKIREDEINKTREEWIKILRAAPGFPKINSNGFSSLYWFLKHVEAWQSAHIQSKSFKAQQKKLGKLIEEELEKCNLLFEKYNFERAEDQISAKGILAELKEQNTIHIEELRKIDTYKDRIQEQKRQKEYAEVKLQKIYMNLNINFGEKETIANLVDKLEEYSVLSKDHHAVQLGLGEKKAIIENHSLYFNEKEKLELLGLDQIAEESINLKSSADRLEGLNAEITRIETLIESKKAGHELEDALGKKDEALNKLENLYEENLSSITGNLLVEQLKKQTQEQNRPEVFKRANEIFNRITNSRYELRIQDRGEASFQAYDTVLKLGQTLEEISTGTRVQLLLAVRLAYVETLESNIKIPILADELLANSDDERAQAIIRALIEISKDGRQVFYFTAQQDEVGKWMSFLEAEENLKYKIIQLNLGSSFETTEIDPELSSFSLLQTVASPEGETHETYAEKIEVVKFDILTQSANQLSLWYIIKDLDILYSCLKRGLKFWGQLDSFLRNEGQIEGLTEDKLAGIQEKIELLERFQEMYRRGRSRKIDREVLIASGSVSGNFIDEMTERLDEVNNDPNELIESLKNVRLPNFRTNNLDRLEEYLLNEGYIDAEDILDSDEINRQLQLVILQMNMDIETANSFIQKLLSYQK